LSSKVKNNSKEPVLMGLGFIAAKFIDWTSCWINLH